MKLTLPLKKILVLLILCGYMLLSIFSLIHMSHMSMHGMAMADCPLLPLKQLPGNDINAHLQGWQDFSQIILPIFTLFAVLCFTILLARFLHFIPPVYFVPQHIGFDPPPIWERLLASGILHPKAP